MASPTNIAGSEAISDDELAAHWNQLMRDHARVVCALDRTLGERFGLSSTDFEVLEQLVLAGRDAKMSDVAERVHLSQSAFSRTFSRLEKAGYVERATCAEDRRAVKTNPTPAGRRLYAKARPVQRATLRDEAQDCEGGLLQRSCLPQ